MKRLALHAALPTLGLLLLGTAPAEAQITTDRNRALTRPVAEEVGWTDATRWRGPSGFPGTHSQTYMAEPDRALTSMNWREKQDDPVWFEFVGRTLCADEECGEWTDHHFSLESGNVLSQKWVVTGDEHYATGLNVCTSGSGKIKGVRLWGARIRADRTLQESGRQEFTRTNCRNWHTARHCPDGAVIVGLRAHYIPEDGYVGLSIRCGRVV